MEVRTLTVGPLAENCYLLRADAEAAETVVVDPGEEAERIFEAVTETGSRLAAILLTHCHFDHIGAVAPLARLTGAPVYCPEGEREILADIMSYVSFPGVGPFESYEADHLVAGGDSLDIAGIEFDVVSTPGHSRGHVTYAVPAAGVLLSGDVLFRGSVGRVDLPGGDGPTLIASIRELLDRYPDETMVYPGHMGPTTLGTERLTNPFLDGEIQL